MGQLNIQFIIGRVETLSFARVDKKVLGAQLVIGNLSENLF